MRAYRRPPPPPPKHPHSLTTRARTDYDDSRYATTTGSVTGQSTYRAFALLCSLACPSGPVPPPSKSKRVSVCEAGRDSQFKKQRVVRQCLSATHKHTRPAVTNTAAQHKHSAVRTYVLTVLSSRNSQHERERLAFRICREGGDRVWPEQRYGTVRCMPLHALQLHPLSHQSLTLQSPVSTVEFLGRGSKCRHEPK